MPLSQPGIFNVLDYEFAATNSPGENQTALQNAIADCQSQGGGTVLIPTQDLDGNTVYPIIGPIDVGEPLSGSAESVIIEGTAQGPEGSPTLLVEGAGTLFSVDTSSGHIGGITFRDFGIQYGTNPDTGSPYSGTAIDVVAGENVRIERMVFFECAQAVWFENTLQCTIFDCRAENKSIVPSPAFVSIGNDETGALAVETYIAACTFLADKLGGTGFIIQGAEHLRVMNVRIEGVSEGINIVPEGTVSDDQNSIKFYFGNVTVFPYNPDGPTGPAVTIQPVGSRNVSEIVFAECVFEPSESGVSAGPGVYIDEGDDGATISDVRFVSCKATRWTGPGIEIVSGTNIEILGGLYAANASGASPSGGSGGISITGPATNIRIIGAACIGTYPYIVNQGAPSDLPAQDVGIYILGAGVSNVIIDHCDLTGNSENGVVIASSASVTSVFIRNCNVSGYGSPPSPSAAIDVAGEAADVQITDCAGYNDHGAVLSTSAPTGTFNNTTFSYYGPIAFYVTSTSPVSITIDGVVTGLASGGFTLGPGETAVVAGSVSRFLAVGK
jgi:hypothetical protein